MASLAGLRAEVISGDFRPLFLAWLAELQTGEVDSEAALPPIPPGLRKLTASQSALVNFLGIDFLLIEMVAAETSDNAAPINFDLDAALSRVASADKDQWLKELIEADDPHAGLRIKLKLQATVLPAQPRSNPSSQKSAGELFERYQKYTEELDERNRRVEEAKRKAAMAEAAAIREKHLDDLARDIPGAWRNVEQMIASKNQEDYKQAVALLADLRDLSNRPGGGPADLSREFARCLVEHSRKGNFIRMVQAAGLNGS